MDRRRHGDGDTRPKVCRTYFRKEDYVDYVGYSLIASVQKFLVERVEDEDVTELTTPSGHSQSREGPRGYAGYFLIAP